MIMREIETPFMTQREALDALGFTPIETHEQGQPVYEQSAYGMLGIIAPYIPHADLQVDASINTRRYIGPYIEAYRKFLQLPMWGTDGRELDVASAEHFARTQRAQRLIESARGALYQAIIDDETRGSTFLKIKPIPSWEKFIALRQNKPYTRPGDSDWRPYTDENISARQAWWSCHVSDNFYTV